jgi:predicted regulator of Ras-like GTPase activity (Roadblock/LC7/MglB family)
MNWFERLESNPYIDSIILADNQGNILRSTRVLRSSSEIAASMLQSAEVLAQTLAEELGCGAAQMLQISTQWEHIMLFPVMGSTYYLVIQVERSAPLMLVMVDVERALDEMKQDDLVAMRRYEIQRDDTPVLDAAELIEAVQTWLRNRPTE